MNSDFCVAVHTLVYLNHCQQALSSEELAKNVCTHPVRIRRVTAKLCAAGLLQTREGAQGGCRFVLMPQQVTLLQVAQALQTRFVSSGWHSGDEHQACRIASGMAGVMDELFEELDACCRQRLASITLADVDQKLFENKKADSQ